MRRNSSAYRPAFTLVELMMVVVIIGILVGLLLPAVYFGMQSVKKAAIGMEVQTLASAIEQYKNKYGDYPPDGSNVAIFQRHYRKLFKQIAESEFGHVAGACNAVNGAPAGAYMDPPEALVFALGGFSTDPVHPFTGPGGPIVATTTASGTTYQYNTDRNEPLYEFKPAQLSLDATGAASTDEFEFYGGTNDWMPVYRAPYGRKAPFVYFDSRSYSFAAGGAWFFNNYGSNGASVPIGFARPYKSEQVNTNVGTTPDRAEAYYKYMNDRTFQIVSAGLDDNFGGVPFSGNGPVLFKFPSGEDLDFSGWTSSNAPTKGNRTRYKDGNDANPQLDNTTNFSEGILENSLTN